MLSVMEMGFAIAECKLIEALNMTLLSTLLTFYLLNMKCSRLHCKYCNIPARKVNAPARTAYTCTWTELNIPASTCPLRHSPWPRQRPRWIR